MSNDFTYLDYINDISSSKIPSCKSVKLAVKRYIEDLEKSQKGSFPYYFDHHKAQNAIVFFCQLVHTKGKLAGQKLHTEPWQQFIIASIYGWRRKDNDLRRFRKAYIQIARKNGKTFLAAGFALYDLLTENGSECYSAATKKDQSRICFDAAKKTVQYSPDLRKYIKAMAHSLVCGDGFMKPLASDSNTLDGLNPSCAIIDEFHAHKTRELYEVIETGMRARTQPLMFIITTAGNDRNVPCYEEYERCKKMLSKSRGYENDEVFAYICELDKGDDWKNEQNWYKANPNLGVSVELDSMRTAFNEAKTSSSAEAAFRTKNLNEWLNVAEVWITANRWQKCKKRFSEKNLNGLRCWGGIDLSKRLDITAFTWYFDLKNGKRYAKHYFFIPENQIETKMKTDSYLFRQWINQGYVFPTPGDTVDYSFMFKKIIDDAQIYDVQEIAYDRNLAAHLIQDLSDTFTCVEFNQGIVGMSEPSKAWEQLIADGKLIDNNPVMDWMVSCCVVKADANGNIKPIKPDSGRTSKRIDGVITSIMANNRLEIALADEEANRNFNIDDAVF